MTTPGASDALSVPSVAGADLTVTMSTDAARRLTERIKVLAEATAEHLDKLQMLVAQAKAGQVHVVLGYPSWTAYVADVFSAAQLSLNREDRRDVVAYLSSEGMSTRAVAGLVGVDDRTVRRDLAGAAYAAPDAPEVVGGDVVEDRPEPHRITGTDGKSYPSKAVSTKHTEQTREVRRRDGETYRVPLGTRRAHGTTARADWPSSAGSTPPCACGTNSRCLGEMGWTTPSPRPRRLASRTTSASPG